MLQKNLNHAVMAAPGRRMVSGDTLTNNNARADELDRGSSSENMHLSFPDSDFDTEAQDTGTPIIDESNICACCGKCLSRIRKFSLAGENSAELISFVKKLIRT